MRHHFVVCVIKYAIPAGICYSKYAIPAVIKYAIPAGKFLYVLIKYFLSHIAYIF